MTTVKDILARIEKLKSALSEKNLELAEREAELSQAREELAEAKRLAMEQEKITKALQNKLARESQNRNEAYNLAANVEALTKAQREVFELRKRLREVTGQSVEMPAVSGDPLDHALTMGGDPDGADQSAEIFAAIEEQQRQIDELERESNEKDDAMIEMQMQIEEAEKRANAAQAKMREIEQESIEKDSVIAEQQAQLFGQQQG